MSATVLQFPAPERPLTDTEMFSRLGPKRYWRLSRIAQICTNCLRPVVVCRDEGIPCCDCDEPRTLTLQEVAGP